MQWFDSCTLFWAGASLIVNGLVAYFWRNKFYLKLGLRGYQAIQRIHLNETPRLGGCIFYISLIGVSVYCDANESILFLRVILFCLLPIAIIGLKEDLFHNVEPVIRLIGLLLVGWLFTSKYTGPLPNLTEIPFVRELLLINGGVSLFYIISMIAIANGMNLIDGVNGLCSAVALSILSALLFLSYRVNDVAMLSLIFSIIVVFVPFVILNYPYGRIFLGDMGAYILGLIVSMLTIILFGRHPEISPWGAVLILMYPATELFFSILRRVIKGSSIYHPDTDHLHIQLFYFFRPQPAFKKVANAIVTPILSGLWLLPLLTITWAYQKPFFIFIAIILFIMTYSLFYATVTKVKKNKKKAD